MFWWNPVEFSKESNSQTRKKMRSKTKGNETKRIKSFSFFFFFITFVESSLPCGIGNKNGMSTKNNMWLETVIHILAILGACNTHAMMLALLKQFLIRQNKKFGSMMREKKKSTHLAVRVYAKTLMIILWYFWWLQNINSETISVKLNEYSIHRVREREREKLEIVIRLVKMVDIIRNRSYTHPEQAASNHRMHIWF